MTDLAVFALFALVLAYAVWATRDVVLKRMRSDARMDALEKTCKSAIENLAKQMHEAVGDLPERVTRLETNRGGAQVAAAQGWRAPR